VDARQTLQEGIGLGLALGPPAAAPGPTTSAEVSSLWKEFSGLRPVSSAEFAPKWHSQVKRLQYKQVFVQLRGVTLTQIRLAALGTP